MGKTLLFNGSGRISQIPIFRELRKNVPVVLETIPRPGPTSSKRYTTYSNQICRIPAGDHDAKNK